MSESTYVQGIIAGLIAREGGYSNDPADPGAETNYGITIAVARVYGYDGSMRLMPMTTASDIYLQRYWLQPALDKVDTIDAPLAAKLLDAGVNCGPVTAGRWLQRALNSLNDGGTRFPDLVVDGHLGPMSLQALKLFEAQRGDDGRAVLLAMVRAQQSVAYIEDAERRPASERFEYGWQRARAMV